MDLNQGPPGKEKNPLRLQDPAKSEKPEQVVKKKKKMIRNLNLIRKLCQFMRARCFNVQFAIKSSIQK